MSKIRHLIYIIAVVCIAVFTSCDGERAELLKINSASGKAVVTLQGVKKQQYYKFDTNGDWTITDVDAGLTITPMSGKAGKDSVLVSYSDYNCTNEDVTAVFSIESKNSDFDIKQNVSVVIEPVIRLESTVYNVDAKGDTLIVRLHCDAPEGTPVYVASDKTFEEMTKKDASEEHKRDVTRAGSVSFNYSMDFVIRPNESANSRTGTFYICLDKEGEMRSDIVTVNQMTVNIGESTDTISNNGKVSQLQKHTIGKGVPVVLMGDGFIDTDITSGRYREAMEQAMEHVFDVYPMTNLKDYFDVYEVTAVSKNNQFSPFTSTAFSCKFGDGTLITGNDDKALQYAKKAVSDASNVLVIVVLNDTRYAGTCSLYSDGRKAEIPAGHSVAYVPMTDASLYGGIGFAEILHHEAIGHGFGKLGDEYSNAGTITKEATLELQGFQQYGFCSNISLESDVTKTAWANFAALQDYSSEALSCYEGAYTFLKGVYRPTKNSIMKENDSQFNAPSRYMIFRRCKKIAQEDPSAYSFDAFLLFDANRPSTPSLDKVTRSASAWRTLPRLARPRMLLQK